MLLRLMEWGARLSEMREGAWLSTQSHPVSRAGESLLSPHRNHIDSALQKRTQVPALAAGSSVWGRGGGRLGCGGLSSSCAFGLTEAQETTRPHRTWAQQDIGALLGAPSAKAMTKYQVPQLPRCMSFPWSCLQLWALKTASSEK